MINKKTKVVLVCIITMLCMFICLNKVYAIEISPIEYTKEYKQWLELPDEEKKTKAMPKMFNIETNSNSNNIFSQARILRNTLIDTKFDLRDIISTNLAIRSQGNTNACWAFATLSSLETNLAYNDYKNNKTNKVYDFSESHMDYSTSQSFNDGSIENGFTREVGVGGNFQVGGAYLTNGQGAVLESDMPFISTKENISLNDIEDKEVVTKVTDTEEFSSYTNTIELNELMTKMKEHIKENGSISAGIYGAEIFSDYYNNATGAIYCNNESCEMNHNISIIGWDDNYSIDNFNENNKPNRNGAWIIRNSWGDKTKIGSINDFKEYILRQYPEKCETMGWHSKDDIPTEGIIQIVREAGYAIEDEEVYQPVGDNGFMYVSYEDIHIYKQLFGIEKATTNVDYYNIYQYNDLGYNYGINLNVNKAYLANAFDRNSSEKEELTEVSLNVMQKVKCKVYVNSKNDSKAFEDIQLVELKDGDSEIFDAGYHTLEFKNPILLTGDKFVVVIEIEALNSNQLYCVSISKTNNNIWDNIEVNDGESYISHGEYFQNNVWIDTVSNAADMHIEPSNLTIKAFTKEIDEPTPTASVMPTITPVVTPTVIPVVTPTPTSTSITPMPTVSTTPTITPTSSVIPTNSPSIKPTGLVVTSTTTPRAASSSKPITISSTSNANKVGTVINSNSTSVPTTTTESSSLPHTGKTSAIIILILILSINITIVYIKYKKVY